MLASMLGVCERAVVVPEAHFLQPLLANDLTTTRLSEIATGPKFGVWDVVPDYDSIKQGQMSFQAIVEYLVRLYAAKEGVSEFSVWIDHTPSHIGHAFCILKELSEAKFIHLVRDARAVASSVCRLDWGPSSPTACAMDWVNRVGQGIALELASPDKTLRVHYESLVSAPQETLKRVCSFLDISYTDKMVAGGGFRLPTASKGQHRLVGTTPDKSRMNLWREQLSPEAIEEIERVSGNMLLHLGYSTDFYPECRVPSRYARFRYALVDLVRPRLDRFRYGFRNARVRGAAE